MEPNSKHLQEKESDDNSSIKDAYKKFFDGIQTELYWIDIAIIEENTVGVHSVLKSLYSKAHHKMQPEELTNIDKIKNKAELLKQTFLIAGQGNGRGIPMYDKFDENGMYFQGKQKVESQHSYSQVIEQYNLSMRKVLDRIGWLTPYKDIKRRPY